MILYPAVNHVHAKIKFLSHFPHEWFLKNLTVSELPQNFIYTAQWAVSNVKLIFEKFSAWVIFQKNLVTVSEFPQKWFYTDQWTVSKLKFNFWDIFRMSDF